MTRRGHGSPADQAARRLAKARKYHDREVRKAERLRCAEILRKESTRYAKLTADTFLLAAEVLEQLPE